MELLFCEVTILTLNDRFLIQITLIFIHLLLKLKLTLSRIKG